MNDTEKLLQELNNLIMLDPDKAKAVFDAHPELTMPVLGELHKQDLAQRVRHDDSPGSWAAFCELIDGAPPPKHVMRQAKKVYADHKMGVGTVIHASRGFRKTTYWDIKFGAYRIGKEPGKTNVVVGAVDDSPEKVTKSIAAMIEFHPEWKRVFPNIVPDKDRGWSLEGFFVKDTSMDYTAWVAKQSSTNDPTFLGGGYESRRLNGKHPSGWLIIDDIHDINNNSDKQRSAVVLALTTVILKTVIRKNDMLDTWVLGVGVPWASDDGYQTMLNSGYGYTATPAMVRAEEGAENAIYLDGFNPAAGVVYEDIKGWWVLQFPEVFGVNAIIQERSFGKSQFWQMIMLDIKTAKTGGLRYYLYPHDRIDPTWVHSGGVDFATLKDARPDAGRDKFAKVEGAKTPLNQLVVTDVIVEQCTQSQAEEYMANSHKRHRNWRSGIFEGDGAGEQFYLFFVQRNPGAKWSIKKTGGKAKRYRQEQEMGPWLENGTVLISDAPTDGLLALRKSLDDFPDGNNDVRDGLYWLCHAFPEVLIMPVAKEGEGLPGKVRKVQGLTSAWSRL